MDKATKVKSSATWFSFVHDYIEYKITWVNHKRPDTNMKYTSRMSSDTALIHLNIRKKKASVYGTFIPTNLKLIQRLEVKGRYLHTKYLRYWSTNWGAYRKMGSKLIVTKGGIHSDNVLWWILFLKSIIMRFLKSLDTWCDDKYKRKKCK